MLDILISNGYVIDGMNNPWTKMDVAIKDGKIVDIKHSINQKAKEVIDATNKFVSPGFIDTHVHSDLMCFYPKIHQIKLKQGVTTELLGQDGISVAPVNDETKSLWQKQLKGLNGDIGDWNWNSVADYLKHLKESDIINNMTYLVPHGNVRTLVMGFEKRQASTQEIKEMRSYVEEGMRQGAVGFSTGLVYPPNVFSSTEELIEICKGVAQHDGCFVVHMRNESFNILEAVDEMLTVAKESNVRLHISHLKVIGIKNRHFYSDVLDKIAEARSQGIEVTFDQYPYTAGSTVFHAILPPWVHDGGTEYMLNRLRDPMTRAEIIKEMETSKDYENWVLNCGWNNIIVSSVEKHHNKQYEGKSVEEIAKHKGDKPADVALDLLVEEKGNVTMIVYWGKEEDIEQAMKSPYHIVGSDSIFGSKPHPRLSGTYPRMLSKYVRERKVLRLEEAIHRMTGAPAQLLRLDKRGILQKGYWADIVVFDADEVSDQATYENPKQDPVGIDYVIVNGHIGVKQGECNLRGNGTVL